MPRTTARLWKLLPHVAETGVKILLTYSNLRNFLKSVLKFGELVKATLHNDLTVPGAADQ